MAAIISLKSIQQVVSSLPYPSAKSLKSRLIQAVMQYYEEADTVRTLQFIPSEALIQKLWPTANNPDLIRKKQKNLSSVRSSVNIDLKKLASDGDNPDGLQLNSTNIFVMSEEAKDKALDAILDKMPGDTPASLDEITKILQMVDGMLSKLEQNGTNEGADRQHFVTELKSVVDGITQKIGSDTFDTGDNGVSDPRIPENLADQQNTDSHLEPESSRTPMGDGPDTGTALHQGDGLGSGHGNDTEGGSHHSESAMVADDKLKGDDDELEDPEFVNDIEEEDIELADDIVAEEPEFVNDPDEAVIEIEDNAVSSDDGGDEAGADQGGSTGAAADGSAGLGQGLESGADKGTEGASQAGQGNNQETGIGAGDGSGASDPGPQHVDAVLSTDLEHEPSTEDGIEDDELEELEFVDDAELAGEDGAGGPGRSLGDDPHSNVPEFDIPDADAFEELEDDEVDLEELEFVDSIDPAGSGGDEPNPGTGNTAGDGASAATGPGENIESGIGIAGGDSGSTGKTNGSGNADGINVGQGDRDGSGDGAGDGGSASDPGSELLDGDTIQGFEDNVDDVDIIDADELEDPEFVNDIEEEDIELADDIVEEEPEFANDPDEAVIKLEDNADFSNDGGNGTGADQGGSTGAAADGSAGLRQGLGSGADKGTDGAPHAGQSNNQEAGIGAGDGSGASDSGPQHIDAALSSDLEHEPSPEDEIEDDELEELEFVDDADPVNEDGAGGPGPDPGRGLDDDLHSNVPDFDIPDADAIEDLEDDEVDLEELEFVDSIDPAGSGGDEPNPGTGNTAGDGASAATGPGENIESGIGIAGGDSGSTGKTNGSGDAGGINVGQGDRDGSGDGAGDGGSASDPGSELLDGDAIQGFEDNVVDVDIIDEDELEDPEFVNNIEAEEPELVIDADEAVIGLEDNAVSSDDGGDGAGTDQGGSTGDAADGVAGLGQSLESGADKGTDGAPHAGQSNNQEAGIGAGDGSGASDSGPQHVDAALSTDLEHEPSTEDGIEDDELEELEFVDDAEPAGEDGAGGEPGPGGPGHGLGDDARSNATEFDIPDADDIEDLEDDEVDLEELEFVDNVDPAGSGGDEPNPDTGNTASDDASAATGPGKNIESGIGIAGGDSGSTGKTNGSGDADGIYVGQGDRDGSGDGAGDGGSASDPGSELLDGDTIQGFEDNVDAVEIIDDDELEDPEFVNDIEEEDTEIADDIVEEEPEFVIDADEAVIGLEDNADFSNDGEPFEPAGGAAESDLGVSGDKDGPSGTSLGEVPKGSSDDLDGEQYSAGDTADQASPDNLSADNGLDRVEALGVEEVPDWSQNPQKAKLLAEEFNRSLAAMDKFYNQYVIIPKGSYVVGSLQSNGRQKLERTIELPEYYIGKFPVTNALFELFIENTGYQTTAEKQGKGTVYTGRSQHIKDTQTGREHKIWHADIQCQTVSGACWYQPRGPGSTIHKKRNHPVVQVSLQDAMAFAAWTGKRLPSETEWEAAARTLDSLTFPWGNVWQSGGCNIEESGISDTTPVDTYLDFINKFGVADTLGNVLEWTSCTANGDADKDLSADYIVKGGSWISGPELRLHSQFQQTSEGHSNLLGFRCVAF